MRRAYAPRVENTGFTAGNLTNLFAIPVMTGIIAVAGFYYVTTYRLDEYSIEIAKVNKVVAEKASSDDVVRTKLRDDFLASQLRTNEGIAKLDTRLAVAETNQKTANDTLSKIADTLQRITTVAVSK